MSEKIDVTTFIKVPREVEVRRKLQALRSPISFMNTGAHPDDETSRMLAAFSLRDGINISYACANRGEGGQNIIGTESEVDLGIVRTREMEASARHLNMELYWLCETQEDTINDFGFSKSGTETLKKWGYERTLKRFVDIIRTERPDIICPTFLDVPGQHGHHRAMTQLAHEVMSVAADPMYKGSSLPVWQIKKLYLPAWSGGGAAYDDEVPPPKATHLVDCNGIEQITGFSWAEIGEQSRAFHQTQGMGNKPNLDFNNSWPLHLAETMLEQSSENVSNIFAGLPSRLSELSEFANVPNIKPYLDEADDYIAALIEEGASLSLNKQHLRSIKKPIIKAIAECPNHAETEIIHRLNKKLVQLNELENLVSATPDQSPTVADKYYDVVGIESAIEVSPNQLLFIKGSSEPKSVEIFANHNCFNTLEIDLPKSWEQQFSGTHIAIMPDTSSSQPATQYPINIGGERAFSSKAFEYPHISKAYSNQPATVEIAIIDVKTASNKIGYFGGGNDRVYYWLKQIGLSVDSLDASNISIYKLSNYETIVVGIFAFLKHKGLSNILPQIHEWVENGGNLVTLYHRPSDNWDSGKTPLRQMEIGSPSLRWRVTDENAAVTHLCPDHPLLNYPNKIIQSDWDNWHKERGLYFAKDWHTSYVPLLSMADQNEQPLLGSLLSAKIGKGRHTHTSLILHHQLEKMVEGAFKLISNLVATNH